MWLQRECVGGPLDGEFVLISSEWDGDARMTVGRTLHGTFAHWWTIDGEPVSESTEKVGLPFLGYYSPAYGDPLLEWFPAKVRTTL